MISYRHDDLTLPPHSKIKQFFLERCDTWAAAHLSDSFVFLRASQLTRCSLLVLLYPIGSSGTQRHEIPISFHTHKTKVQNTARAAGLLPQNTQPVVWEDKRNERQ